jgi:hypothetical protein
MGLVPDPAPNPNIKFAAWTGAEEIKKPGRLGVSMVTGLARTSLCSVLPSAGLRASRAPKNRSGRFFRTNGLVPDPAPNSKKKFFA